MALNLLFIKYEVHVDDTCTHVCNTHVCVGREGLGAKSFLDLTDRNVGAVFWQCFLFLKKTIFSNENDSSQVLRS